MKITDRKYYPWLLVISYSLLGIFFPAAVTQYSMVVGDVAEALGVSTQTVLLTDNVRAICLVCSMFLANFMYRKLGLRKTMALGLILQILPQFAIPLVVRSGFLPGVFILKGMQGLNSMAFPLYISTITLWMSERYAGLATAIFNGSFAAGSGIGAWLAGRIVPYYGWEKSFYLIGGICLFFAIPVMAITRDKERIETPSSVAAANENSGTYKGIIRQSVTWILILALLANTWVTQAITVDMSVYASYMNYSAGDTGTLMLAISCMTVLASIIAGAVSDWVASRSQNTVKARSLVMALGYILCAIAAVFLPGAAAAGYGAFLPTACAMMFGAAWACGVFWALPVEVYHPQDNVSGTAFCSSASNIPNPIATMTVGVLLGANGHWTAGWMTCAIVSVISLAACLLLTRKGNANQYVNRKEEVKYEF